jgi:hypothetical protein
MEGAASKRCSDEPLEVIKCLINRGNRKSENRPKGQLSGNANLSGAVILALV